MVNKRFFKSKFLKLFVGISLVVVILDQLLKYIILVSKPNINLGFLTIQYIENTGAGFGLFKTYTGLLSLISLIVAISIIYFYKKIDQEKIPQILFGLFLGGVVGNLIDRLLRGYVIDFFNLSFWPAFNVADSAISVSVIGLVVYYWKK